MSLLTELLALILVVIIAFVLYLCGVLGHERGAPSARGEVKASPFFTFTPHGSS